MSGEQLIQFMSGEQLIQFYIWRTINLINVRRIFDSILCHKSN